MTTLRGTATDRRVVLGALVGLAFSMPVRAAEQASPWARGLHSRMRLAFAGRATADGSMVAVVEIALDKGFKTYWRTPGDSGIPPSFDFTGSDNVRDIKVHFPAPMRFDDGAGGHSIGYVTPLVELPVTYRAIDAEKPSRLRLKLDYAVCEKICVPASGQVEVLVEQREAASPKAKRLLSMLPTATPLRAPGPLSIQAFHKAGAPERFVVEATVPSGKADLFVEAANPWLFDVKPAEAAAQGRLRFTVIAIDKDKSPDCKGVEATFTLVAGDKAIETTTWLDVSLLSP
jgi:DsbC/DsbD-like thiol-disulfide interchange protein